MIALNCNTVHTPAAATDEESSTGGDGEYLVVALGVGIPCILIILVLFLVILFIIYLTLKSSRYNQLPDDISTC